MDRIQARARAYRALSEAKGAIEDEIKADTVEALTTEEQKAIAEAYAMVRAAYRLFAPPAI